MAKKPKTKTFTDELRDAIETADKTRYQLSKEIGLDQATLSRFINGTGGLSMRGLDRIAAALGLHVAIEQPKRKGK